MAFTLLDHDPSCLSCPCPSDKVQFRVQVGQVSVVLWRHLAILNSTIPASSNSRSKAEVSVSRLNHWLDSKIPAMRLLQWTVLAAWT